MWLPDAKTLCKSERLVSALVPSKSIDLLLARSGPTDGCAVNPQTASTPMFPHMGANDSSATL